MRGCLPLVLVTLAVLAFFLVHLGAAPGDVAVGDIRAALAKSGTRLRETPKALGRSVRTLAYGQQLRVEETRGSWIRVSMVGGVTGEAPRTGWVRAKETVQPFALTQGGQGGAKVGGAASGVSQADVNAAGRQFDRGTEASYRRAHPNLQSVYPLVDKIEANEPTPDAIDAFIRAGRLGRPDRGGQ